MLNLSNLVLSLGCYGRDKNLYYYCVDNSIQQPRRKQTQMSPTPEFNMNTQMEDGDEHSSIEKMKAFQHSRNMTGVVGDSKWHSDIKVNDLWDKLSVPEANGSLSATYAILIIL